MKHLVSLIWVLWYVITATHFVGWIRPTLNGLEAPTTASCCCGEGCQCPPGVCHSEGTDTQPDEVSLGTCNDPGTLPQVPRTLQQLKPQLQKEPLVYWCLLFIPRLCSYLMLTDQIHPEPDEKIPISQNSQIVITHRNK